MHKPSGKGPRFIIVHAMTTAGWVQGAQLVFQAKRRTGDDHGQRDFEHCRRWFCRSFFLFMFAVFFIVRENAPSHNVDVDGVFSPTTATKKGALRSWRQPHHPTLDQEAMSKAELLVVCRQLCPKPA